MPELTPSHRETFLANSRANRYNYPPVALGGIGQEPLALVPAVFGGIGVVGPVANQPLGTTPEKITGFDQVVPDFATSGIYPEGLIADAASDELRVAVSGVYLVNIRINATVTTGAAYRFEVYLNGVATGIYTGQDLSNQSGFLSAVLISPGKVSRGDLVSVYGSADAAGRAFAMQNSSMFLSMIR